MEVYFRSEKLAKICNSKADSDRKWGDQVAKRLRLRLVELLAADSLADMTLHPAARCHPLKGDRDGQFAVDLKHPSRLIFEPANDPLPQLESGGLDLNKVTQVRILGVEDYHGK